MGHALGTGGASVLAIVITILVFAFMIYRQVRPRQLSVRGLVIVPVILLFFIARSSPALHLTSSKLLGIAVDVVVSLVLGLLATRQLEVYASPETGRAMVRGSWTYFLWWLGAFVIKGAVAVALGEATTSMNSVELIIPLFLLVITRNAYLYWKATQLGLRLHGV